jgi:hypothetical protein
MNDEVKNTGPGKLLLPPGVVIGVDPQTEWDALVTIPDEFLERVKADVFSALSQGAPWQMPISLELGMLASLLKEVQQVRADLPPLPDLPGLPADTPEKT